MNRTSILLTAVGLATAGSIVFRVKYEVMDLEQQLKTVKRQIQDNQETLHVLKAEWSHLNDPRALQNLAVKYLPELKPLQGSQLVTISHVVSSSNNKKTYDKKALDNLVIEATTENTQNKESE
jgi:cell division protein FtsL